MSDQIFILSSHPVIEPFFFRYFDKNDIPYKKCGKLIVATNPAEVERLKDLHVRGIQNGVPDLKTIEKDEIKKIEPHCQVNSFLEIEEEIVSHMLFLFFQGPESSSLSSYGNRGLGFRHSAFRRRLRIRRRENSFEFQSGTVRGSRRTRRRAHNSLVEKQSITRSFSPLNSAYKSTFCFGF